MKLFVLLVLLIGTGCASTPTCSSDEKVSVCRAQVNCGKGSVGYIMGALTPAGRKVLNSCIDRDLAAQRSNAGITDRSVSCVSEKDGDQVVTKCDSGL